MRWQTLAIWLVAGTLAVLSCTLGISRNAQGIEYLPVGNDSYYHAARILETAADPASFAEFDPRIHAPEGSIVTWPWGYDYSMARLVRIGVGVGLTDTPLHVLLWIPVVAVLAAVALLMLIARQLGLSDWPVALVALAFALSTSVPTLFGFGQIDHHYAEFLLLLASLAAGLTWLRSPGAASGIVLGVVLGIAVAIHTGLFVLQLPLLATLFARWLQDHRVATRPMWIFVAALLGTAVAVLIPSLPFRLGYFEFYRLSWFHLYVTACTAAVVLWFSYVRYTRRTLLVLVGCGVLALVPLLAEIRLAQSFLAGSLGMLATIFEMRSPIDVVLTQPSAATHFYTPLIWLAPITLLLCAIQCWRERSSPRLLFWVASVLGLMLLALQVRLHYFGDIALYVPWIVLAQDVATRRAEKSQLIFLLLTLVLAGTYGTVIRSMVATPVPRAGDDYYSPLEPVFPALAAACEKDPGIVLADMNAGHYIRYFTKCSVIADTFLLTKQDFEKVAEMNRLFSLTAAELPKATPHVKYALVRPAWIRPVPGGEFRYIFFDGANAPALARDLLFAPEENVPAGYQLLGTMNITLPEARDRPLPYVRVYKISSRLPEKTP
jgi:hypothetical protein